MSEVTRLASVGDLSLLEDDLSNESFWFEVDGEPKVQVEQKTGKIRVRINAEEFEELVSQFLMLYADDDDDSEELEEDEWSEEEDPDDVDY